MEKRKSVRLNSKSPSPYLKDQIKTLLGPEVVKGKKVPGDLTVADLGCGAGRNSIYMMDQGCRVVSFDMKDDYGVECLLGVDKIPLADKSCDIILINYLLMFLSFTEIEQLMGEVNRIAKPGCRLMVEMYAAKTSKMPDDKSIEVGMSFVESLMGNWQMIEDKDDCRFIAVKE